MSAPINIQAAYPVARLLAAAALTAATTKFTNPTAQNLLSKLPNLSTIPYVGIKTADALNHVLALTGLRVSYNASSAAKAGYATLKNSADANSTKATYIQKFTPVISNGLKTLSAATLSLATLLNSVKFLADRHITGRFTDRKLPEMVDTVSTALWTVSIISEGVRMLTGQLTLQAKLYQQNHTPKTVKQLIEQNLSRDQSSTSTSPESTSTPSTSPESTSSSQEQLKFKEVTNPARTVIEKEVTALKEFNKQGYVRTAANLAIFTGALLPVLARRFPTLGSSNIELGVKAAGIALGLFANLRSVDQSMASTHSPFSARTVSA